MFSAQGADPRPKAAVRIRWGGMYRGPKQNFFIVKARALHLILATHKVPATPLFNMVTLLHQVLFCREAQLGKHHCHLLESLMSLCPLWVLVELPRLCWAQRPLPGRVWSLPWPQAPTAPLFLRCGANRSLRDTNSLLLPHLSHEVHELLASFLHPLSGACFQEGKGALCFPSS